MQQKHMEEGATVNELDLLKGCELHLHVVGAFYADDALALGRAVYQDVDWRVNRFLETYRALFGVHPDPIGVFDDAITNGEAAFERLRRLHTYTEADGRDFTHFQAKFNFFLCLWNHYRHQGPRAEELMLRRMIERYRSQGLDYIEYRYGLNIEPDFLSFHQRCTQLLQDASDSDMTAHYIIGLPRWAPLEGYTLVQQLLDERPDLIPTIVGVDFAGLEEGYPPKRLRPFFAQVAKDNRAHPERALDIVCHVGESFFDKSLESAIRWCHESAEMGARRLGHAIALGLDPAIAIARRPQAHVWERVSERLDQLAYDLHYRLQLAQYGVAVDEQALLAERKRLRAVEPETRIERSYDEQRLAEVRQRQRFVLDRLRALGTVIECCPTSNLRIGGVPDASHHPLHRFLASGSNVVICSDDPGIFDITLASEVEWVQEHTALDAEALQRRLGDPRRFRLGQQRIKGIARYL
jgi:adenosine deaminase